jgi:predicted Zn-dependent protease
LGTYFLRYSREYEKQADLLGVQLMARAGYNPLDLIHMFQTIEKQGDGGGPQFLSDHPNPGNREAYITQEASHLRIEGRSGDTREIRARAGSAAEHVASTDDRAGHPPGQAAADAVGRIGARRSQDRNARGAPVISVQELYRGAPVSRQRT